tara:strand:- start:1915 stop:2181 length:267 start_codon:yes stop_codon:yes gene_type:complete
MSKGKRYTEEFKIEAVKQITERGYSVHEVAERLGITTKSLYNWRSQLTGNKPVRQSSDDSVRIAELRRVTEERDILKKAARYFASQPE